MTNRPRAIERPGDGRRRGGRRAILAIALLLAVVGIGTAVWALLDGRRLTAPETLGPPIRITTPAGDRVFLLTGQWVTWHERAGSGRTSAIVRTITDLHVELWAFDAASAATLWRRRIETQRDGSKRGDGAAIEATNPPLAGKLSRETHFYAFDGDGLRITATDARMWRIDPKTLAARPARGGALVPFRADGDEVPPAYHTPNASYTFQARGLDLGRHWLGVLTDDEAARLSAPPAGATRIAEMGPAPLAAFSSPGRYRLWSARVDHVSAAPPDWPRHLPDNWGTRARFSAFAPLPASPEFLQAGLFGRYVVNGARPIWLRDPDSVLVLHRDKLGEEGKLRLTRVAGPEGRVVWDAALPLSVLQAVMPGTKTIVLYGRLFQPQTGAARRDPMHTAREVLVVVDLVSGAVHTHDQSAAAERMR
ncbi:MAG: hypothetical protein FJX67_01965 [Alphaproteobacteria bacterium]|nr:hypothetical protein [Alphaproteobacteria bacterium]